MTDSATVDRPLVITDDPELLDDLIRIAAAAGVETQVCTDPGAARSSWRRARLVVVGLTCARRCAEAGLGRRSGVVLVGDTARTEESWQWATELGADHVSFLPAAESWLVALFGSGGRVAEPVAPCIAVVGGRGGAGASVLASVLAATAAKLRRRTLLIDADPLGGGIDLVLGGEQTAGLRWPDLTSTSGRVSPSALLDALPRLGGGDASPAELSVLSWDRGDRLEVPAEAMSAVLDSGRRGAEVVVVDLPRRVDPAVEIVLRNAGPTLLIVPAEVRACAAAARVAAGLAQHCEEIEVVVRGPSPSRLKARDIAGALGFPLAGSLRPERALSGVLERGEVPGGHGRSPLATFCREFLDRPGLAAAA